MLWKEPRQPMKGLLAENRPAASQPDVYQLTSDTREEMTRLFYIYSRHSLQTRHSISFLRPALWWNWQLLLLYTQTADGRQECRAPLQCVQEWKVFCGLNAMIHIIFTALQYPIFVICWQNWALWYRSKSYKHATEWQPAWLNINVICELGMASKYRHWHHLGILEYLNIIRENEERGGWHWRYQHKSTPEITT